MNGSAANKRKRRPKVKPIATKRVKSLKNARRVTTAFHVIQQKLETAQEHAGVHAPEVKALEAELAAMGGRKAYQEASVAATASFRTSRFVFQQLTRLERRPKKGDPKLTVLEVGAINTQLVTCPWMNVRAIDIMSRDYRIEQIDFFDIMPAGEYDAIVNSMVINCVTDPLHRGDMLLRSYQHLKPGGLFFLMLPLRCLTKSKHMTQDHFRSLLKHVGFTIEHEETTPKVAFFVLQRSLKVPKKFCKAKSLCFGAFPEQGAAGWASAVPTASVDAARRKGGASLRQATAGVDEATGAPAPQFEAPVRAGSKAGKNNAGSFGVCIFQRDGASSYLMAGKARGEGAIDKIL